MTDRPGTGKPSQDQPAGVAEHILTRIEAAAPTGVWSRIDFLDLGGSFAVEKALQRLLKQGRLRRTLRGLYDLSVKDPVTGRWQVPPVLSFIDAIVRRDRLKVLVDGMTAAHALGLTPARPFSTVIYARTRPRLVKISARSGHRGTAPVTYRLEFKRFYLNMSSFWAGHPAMLLIQAFLWMQDQGEDLNAATKEVVKKLSVGEYGHAIAMDLRLNITEIDSRIQPFMLEIADALHQPGEINAASVDLSLLLSSKSRAG